MIKRFLATVLALVLVMQALPVAAGAGRIDDYIPGLDEWYEYLAGQRPDYMEVVEDDGYVVYLGDEEMILEPFGFQPFGRIAAAPTYTVRYNILVIDVSGSMLGRPMDAARASAQRFVDAALLHANNNPFVTNYVAIVAFGASATVRANFTTDPVVLRNAVNGLRAGGGTAMNAGLLSAEQLLNAIPVNNNPDVRVVRNVLLLSDGLPNVGATRTTPGPFASPQPSWQFANAVYDTAQRLMANGVYMYALGFFHGMSGATLTFARYFKSHLQNRGYFDVVHADDLDFAFDDIIDDMFTDPEDDNVPIIVLHGIMGSSLMHGSDVAWLSLAELTSTWRWPFPDSNLPLLELNTSGDSIRGIIPRSDVYGVSDVEVANIISILRYVPANPIANAIGQFGPAFVESTIYTNLRPNQPMIEGLRAAFGYDMVHYFAYDWRLDNARSAERLGAFIDTILFQSGASRVDIVAHSMGGLVAARYIADGNQRNVRRLITIATPFLGSGKVPYVFATGRMIEVPFLGYISTYEMRRLSSHMLSAYQLLPFRDDIANSPVGQRTLGSFQEGFGLRNVPRDAVPFITNNLPMLNLAGEQVEPSVRSGLMQNAIDFRDGLFLPDGRHIIETVDHHVIIGEGNTRTIRRTYFSLGGSYVVDLSFEDGDGTVPVWSATLEGRITIDPQNRFQHRHLPIFFQPDVINRVVAIIRGDDTDRVVQGPQPRPRTVIRIASPVNTTVTYGGEALSSVPDQQNFHTSFGSLFLVGENLDSELFVVDGHVNPTVKIEGTDYGTMTYSVRFYNDINDAAPIEERVFVDVPITPDTAITSNANRAEETVLTLDDGNVLRPDYVYVIVPPAPAQDVVPDNQVPVNVGAGDDDDWRTPLRRADSLYIDYYSLLSWDTVNNSSGYRVYVGGRAASGTIDVTYFDLAYLELDPGTHRVQVRAIGTGSFRNSPLSSELEYVVPDEPYYYDDEQEEFDWEGIQLPIQQGRDPIPLTVLSRATRSVIANISREVVDNPIQGRTFAQADGMQYMLALRVFENILGTVPQWDDGIITLTGYGALGQPITLVVTVGSTQAFINGAPVDIASFIDRTPGSISPLTIGGRAFLPLRFALDVFQVPFTWDSVNAEVSIGD